MGGNEDDDDPDLVGTQPIPRPVGLQRSGAMRAVSRTDAERLARATADEQLRVDRERQRHENEMTFAEWFGRDGDGGKMATMVDKIERHELAIGRHSEQLDRLTEFKGRVVWIAGGLLTAGGIVAGIAMHFIDKLLK